MTNEQTSHLETLNPSDGVAAQLKAFGERLAKLETATENSTLAKWQKFGAFVALIIGIVLSCLSLFDTLVRKPSDTALHYIEEFNKAVNAVAGLRQTLVRTQIETRNPELVMAMTSMATPQILANIQYATAVLPRLGDRALVPQLIVLIGEAMNIHDWRSAEILINKALSSKENVPSLKSEAFRYQARFFFMTGRPQDGRKAFQDSLNAIRNVPGYGIDGARAFVVADWVTSEFAMGDCTISSERAKQFSYYTRQPQVTQVVRDGLVASLKSQLGQVQAQNPRCPLPENL